MVLLLRTILGFVIPPSAIFAHCAGMNSEDIIAIMYQTYVPVVYMFVYLSVVVPVSEGNITDWKRLYLSFYVYSCALLVDP